MRLEFTNSIALVLLILVPVAVYLAVRGIAGLERLRRGASIAARVVILLLLVLALAGLRARTRSNDIAEIFLVDVSASVAASTRQSTLDFINGELQRAGPRDYVGVVAFGREPSVELAPTRKEALGDFKLTGINSTPPADYTDVAAALRLAAALVPVDATGRLILLSDGRENLESAMEEAPLLRAQSIEVYARQIETVGAQSGYAEVAITDLAAPQKLAEGEPFELKVTVASTTDTGARLRIFRDNVVAGERDVHLVASGDNVFVIPLRAEQKGFYGFRAEIEAPAADSFSQNNSREALSIVEGRPSILYVYGDPKPSPGLMRVITENRFLADVRNSSAVPASLASLQNYDLVIFDNVPASVLSLEQMKMVKAYVKELGGGFIMIGGDQSFGPGGYYKTPVEDVLPVSLDVRQKKHLPSLALALVIDKSGSMSGQKMTLTDEAAAATVSFLSERDSVGVIAFDDSAHPVVNLTKAENKDAIIRQIQAVQPGGGTNMYPGLQMAYDWLASSDAQIKHAIVLSDGVSERGDFGGIARSMRDAGMTVTSVAVGDDADLQTMRFIAETGGGRFYATNSPETLPRIFTREAFMAARSTIIEEPFSPRLIRPGQATQGIDWNSSPQLRGYVGTAERDEPGSPSVTCLISDKDDPVYANWQCGLGRVAAFTSDAKPQWALNWMNWPGFGQFWAQAMRDTMRREIVAGIEPRVEIQAGKGHIDVEASSPEGQFANNLQLQAHVISPDLTSVDVPLEQTASGRYEGEFAATQRGGYIVRVADSQSSASGVSGAVNSYSPEFNIASEDSSLLTSLSQATGGTLISGQGETTAVLDRRVSRTRPREIWQALLLIAVLLWPIDVGIRRVHLTREQLSLAVMRLRAVTRFGFQGRVAATSASLGKLKSARRKVRLSYGGSTIAEDQSSTHGHSAIGHSRGIRTDPSGQLESESAKGQNESGRSEAGQAAAGQAEADLQREKPLATRLLDARRRRTEPDRSG